MEVYFRFSRFLTRLAKDCRGGVMAYAMLIFPVAVGSVAMGVDVAFWHLHTKAAQSAADSAALASALELMRKGSGTTEAVARSAAQQNGVIHNGTDTLVEVYNPPRVGSVNAGSMDSVEVVVTRPAPGFLSNILDAGGEKTIRASAVARSAINDTCIWVLSPTQSGAFTIGGGAFVQLDCGAFSNSADSSSLVQSGSSTLITTKIKTVGTGPGIVDNGGITADVRTTGVSHTADPLAWLPAPSWSACDKNGPTKANAGQTVNITNPTGIYVFCGSISVLAGGTMNFDPGIYVLNAVPFTINNSATVNGTGVHFYFTENGGGTDTLSISGGAVVNLEASNAGALAGILFYHDRLSPGGITHSLQGNDTMQLTGILYFPNQHVQFAGGSNLDANQSLLVVDTITFTGNTTIGDFGGSSVAANTQLIQAELID